MKWLHWKVGLSYRSLRVDASNLQNLLKCFFKRFADHRCPWKFKVCIWTSSILIDVENLNVVLIKRIISLVSVIQSFKAYDLFKAILQSKTAKNSTRMILVSIGEDLYKNENQRIISKGKLDNQTNISPKSCFWMCNKGKKLTTLRVGMLSKIFRRTGSGFSIW